MSVKQKIPKWMKLAEGEELIRTYFLHDRNIIGLFVLFTVIVLGSVFHDFSTGEWGAARFYFALLIPLFISVYLNPAKLSMGVELPGTKIQLTSNRIVVETCLKPKWIGGLDEIRLIKISRRVVGGILEIWIKENGAPVVSAYSIFPAAMAQEIQAACANASRHETEDNKVKGAVK